MIKLFFQQHKYAIFFVFIYLLVNIYFGLSNNVTWDDDCPVRYYNTIDALNNPETFISIWNRPLFTIAFYLPLQLGKFMIPIMMCLITAVSSFFLYLALRKQEIKNAFLIIPFLCFQAYFFGISRNAESEPLAVALISFGYYLMVEKKWFWFALIGGLLPLARLELCLLFPFWGLILLQAKAYKQILLLMLPFVLWNIAGGIITGDYFYVFERTVGQENASNRYGHTTFGHYFQRFIYVTGPIFFFLFSFGFWKMITSNQRKNFFVAWQFVVGFMIYVMFSYKLNMGNSAGFMRHITPVASLGAIIALWGFNYWWSLIQKPEPLSNTVKEAEVQEEQEIESKQLSRKKRKLLMAQKKKEEKKLEAEQARLAKENQKLKRKSQLRYVTLGVLLGVVCLLTYNYFTLKMAFHQDLLEDTTYSGNLYIILLLTGVTVVLLLISLRKKINGAFVGGIIAVSMLVFTAYTEPPNANNSLERGLMEAVSNDFQNEDLEGRKKYVNHVWFFWANDLDKYSDDYDEVTMNNLDSAEIGSICIWETHYSHRLAGDVQESYFKENAEWVQLTYYFADSTRFKCKVYEKVATSKVVDNIVFTDKKGGVAAIKNYIDVTNPRAENYVSLGNYYFNSMYNSDSALWAYDKALEIDSTEIYAIFGKGVAYFREKEWEKAEHEFTNCTQKYPKWIDGWMNRGISAMNLKKHEESISIFTKAIEIDDKRGDAYMNRALAFLALNDTSSAITDFSNVIHVDGKNLNAYINRGILFFHKNYLPDAIKDFEMVVKLDPNHSNGWRLLGVARLNSKQMDAAKEALEKAKMLNDQYAAQLLQTYFRQPVAQE